jgi:hypothetical protein
MDANGSASSVRLPLLARDSVTHTPILDGITQFLAVLIRVVVCALSLKASRPRPLVSRGQEGEPDGAR